MVEKKYSNDIDYAREILAADTRAFFAFGKILAIGNYRKDVPKNIYWSAKLVGTVSEDCGPCTQLLVAMALEDGVDRSVISAVLAGNDAALPADVLLGVKFARAALAHAPEADEYREQIAKLHGPRAVLSLAFAICVARFYPTLKYALGHGKACQRVTVAGENIVVARAS
ncbi:MAG: hypothetical protein M4D80_07840 [Myxococcota bacterium]|nr:hypothetical protein [Myxococcota bacterium]